MADDFREDVASKEKLKLLLDGKLPWEDAKALLKMKPKDSDRFWKYLEILREKVPWKDKILLRISDHLYVVSKNDGRRVVKCDCGHEFGDYRVNWKWNCLVNVRRTREEFAEVYTTEPALPDPECVEIREFYCPGCVAQLAVEVLPPGYPPIFEMLPDLDVFYRSILGSPLEDESPEWFEDRTLSHLASWAAEEQS